MSKERDLRRISGELDKEPKSDLLKGIKIAYVFPGQGSQSVGMGQELYDNSRAAKEVFEEADDTLGFRISKMMFNGSPEDLQDTVNSQPAILTVSYASFRAYEEIMGGKAPKSEYDAGHSLGEYTSLVAAGSINFRDALRLVRERGRLMRDVSINKPGSMAAILGLDEYAFEHICAETGVELGNVNSDDQIVITGDRLAVARAMDLASARGAKKTIPLHVSGAFHSSFMEKAKEGLGIAVENTEIKDSVVPVVANSSAQPISKEYEIRSELTEGLTSCVRWRDSVHTMRDSGVTEYIEFGPTKVLSSLVKRIDKDSGVATFSDTETIKKGMDALMKKAA